MQPEWIKKNALDMQPDQAFVGVLPSSPRQPVAAVEPGDRQIHADSWLAEANPEAELEQQSNPADWDHHATAKITGEDESSHKTTHQVRRWLDSLFESDQSLAGLLSDGYIGFSLKQLIPVLDDDTILDLMFAGDWVVSRPDDEGEVAVMTDCPAIFRIIADLMIENQCEVPEIHAPDDRELPLEALPLQQLTLYNLPAGMRSYAVLSPGLEILIQEIFFDLQQIKGRSTLIYRCDYGALMENAQRWNSLFLRGEFIDLEDRAIYCFTMDGAQQQLMFSDTGRTHYSRSTQSERKRQRQHAARAAERPWQPRNQALLVMRLLEIRPQIGITAASD